MDLQLQETLDADEGPELGTELGTAEDRLVVKPIKDDFGIPKQKFIIHVTVLYNYNEYRLYNIKIKPISK